MATACFGSLMGLGGGLILVPTLLLLHEFFEAFAWATPQTIVGISLVVMIFTGLSSTLSYLKVGRVDYKSGAIFLIGSIPGSIFGSWLNQFFDTDTFLLYFGMVTIIISMLFFLKRKERKQIAPDEKGVRSFEIDGEKYFYRISVPVAVIVSVAVGMVSGLFGIGGGSVMVPVMILLFGFPIHIATATSMFMIFFVSIIGASTHIALGHVAWEYVFFFIPGAWIGAKLGAFVNQRLTGNALEWILRIVLVIIGARMIFQGLT